MSNPNAPLAHLINHRGPYKQYDKEAVIRDIKAGLNNLEIAKKHSINHHAVSKIRCRNTSINKFAVEYAIRDIEKGINLHTIIEKYGEAMYKEALEWHELS